MLMYVDVFGIFIPVVRINSNVTCRHTDWTSLSKALGYLASVTECTKEKK